MAEKHDISKYDKAVSVKNETLDACRRRKNIQKGFGYAAVGYR